MSIDVYEVVKKLTGEIEPIGETQTDDERFENLKAMAWLIEKLLTDINDVAYRCKNNHQYSMKRASEFASKFITDLGIVE